jgi:hypothetical protein
MSAEFELASPPFDTSDIAAAKQGLKSAIERIEAQALPAWLQQQERAVCANARSATADLLSDQGAYRFLDASEIAAAQQGLERAIESIEAEAIPDWSLQAGATRVNDCPATADLPAEIEGACPDGSEIAAAMQRLESAIERIKAEATSACLQQSEHTVCANDRQATADLPSEIEGAYPPFHSSEIVATEQGLESAVERIEAEPIPDWLRQSDVRSGECPATAVNQNEDTPGPLKRLWTRVTVRTTGSYTASPGQDFWLTDLLERASDEASKDEQDFAPKQAHIQ